MDAGRLSLAVAAEAAMQRADVANRFAERMDARERSGAGVTVRDIASAILAMEQARRRLRESIAADEALLEQAADAPGSLADWAGCTDAEFALALERELATTS